MKMIEALIANPNTLTNKQKEMVLRPAIRNYNTDDLKTTITALGPNLDTLKFTIGGLIEEDLGNANQFLIDYLPSGGLTVQQSDSGIISEGCLSLEMHPLLCCLFPNDAPGDVSISKQETMIRNLKLLLDTFNTTDPQKDLIF